MEASLAVTMPTATMTSPLQQQQPQAQAQPTVITTNATKTVTAAATTTTTTTATTTDKTMVTAATTTTTMAASTTTTTTDGTTDKPMVAAAAPTTTMAASTTTATIAEKTTVTFAATTNIMPASTTTKAIAAEKTTVAAAATTTTASQPQPQPAPAVGIPVPHPKEILPSKTNSTVKSVSSVESTVLTSNSNLPAPTKANPSAANLPSAPAVAVTNGTSKPPPTTNSSKTTEVSKVVTATAKTTTTSSDMKKGQEDGGIGEDVKMLTTRMEQLTQEPRISPSSPASKESTASASAAAGLEQGDMPPALSIRSPGVGAEGKKSLATAKHPKFPPRATNTSAQRALSATTASGRKSAPGASSSPLAAQASPGQIAKAFGQTPRPASTSSTLHRPASGSVAKKGAASPHGDQLQRIPLRTSKSVVGTSSTTTGRLTTSASPGSKPKMGDAAATAASPGAAGSGDKPALKDQFAAFSRFGDASSDGKQITLSNCDKWMKQAHVIDGKKITTTDTSIAFKKLFKTAKKVGFEDFKRYVEDLATSKKLEPQDIFDKLATAGTPGLSQATKAASAGVVERLTDTSKYTGSHKERFDSAGKGKGIVGRREVADNTGYVAAFTDKKKEEAAAASPATK